MAAQHVRSFLVTLAAKPVRSLTADDFARFVSAIDLAPNLLAAVPAANLTTGSLRVTATVESTSEEAAFRRGLLDFRRVLSNLSLPPLVAEAAIEEETGDDVSRHELVTGAEVARRLGISRERVRQLAANPRRFPQPRFALGRANVWTWGDILDWADVEKRAVRKPSASAHAPRSAASHRQQRA